MDAPRGQEVGSHHPDRRSRSWRPGLDPLWISAAVLLAVLAHGYAFELGAENQPLQIPNIERLVDPELFPGDPLVDTLDRYSSVFFPATAWMSRWVPLEHQFFILHLLTTALVALAMAHVTRRVLGSWPAAVLAALLLVVSPVVRPTLIGRDTLVAAWVTPTTVSFPILLLALGSLLSGRYARAGFVAGLAAHINAVAAGIFLIVAVPVACGERRRLRSSAMLGIAFLLVALPSLLVLPGDALVRGRGLDFLDLLRRYYPYHFFLDVHSPGVFLRLAILIGAAIAGFRALPVSEPVRRAGRLALSVGITVTLGAIFADVIPVAALTQLHLMRADRWFCVLVYVLAVGLLLSAIARGDRTEAAGAVAITVGLLRAAYPLIAWGAILLLLRPGSSRTRWFIVVAAAAIALWRLWEPIYAFSSALLLLLLLLAMAGKARHTAFALRTGLALALSLAFLEVAIDTGTLSRRGFAVARPVFHPDWREVQDWAAVNTPIAARFMTPPEYAGFRVYSRRSTIVEHKDGAAMLWKPEFGPGWWERLGRVESAVASRDPAEIRAVARRYAAEWIILPGESSPPGSSPGFSLVHSNGRFNVYELSDLEPRETDP